MKINQPTPEEIAEYTKKERQAHARKHLIPFKKGHVPTGHRPVGSRNRLQAGFMYALAEDFGKYGKGAIEHARKIDPMGYIKTVASLMPKQFEQTTPLEELSDSELYAAIAHLRSRISLSPGEGTGEAQEPQSLERLPAVPEAAGLSPGGPGLPGTVADGGKPARKNARGRHGNGHASHGRVSAELAGAPLGPAGGGVGGGGHGGIDP